MREIKISLDTATRWYNGTDEELKGLAIQTYPELAKKELPKTWEELEQISGCYVKGNNALGKQTSYYPTSLNNVNIFATKEQAEASIALAQLSQLREVYRNGWVPDWSDGKDKYCINFFNNGINKDFYITTNSFLSFQDEETRDLFLENFRDLILKAKPLMS